MSPYDGHDMADLSGEATDLLQHLIRNACVNDGSPDSGGESRNAETLAIFLDHPEIERYEAHAGRENLIARIEGSDPKAPTLLLMGHTDVVPANPNRWRRDPFGGELVDGEVWGRGAVDMLDITSTMAVAFRQLQREGFSPKGTLVYLAVADEEALGKFGADWLLEREPDAVRADYVITEVGGARLPLPSPGPRLPVGVAEKGSYWCTLRFGGTPGHASRPFRSENALVKAAEGIRRIHERVPETRVGETWKQFVHGLDLEPDLTEALTHPDRVEDTAETHPDEGLARMMHACTRMTVSPTMASAGVKTNVIPDTAEVQLDIRTLPGQSSDEVRAWLQETLGDLWPEVEVIEDAAEDASVSPTDTPLWHSLQRVSEALVPEARIVPAMFTGATDARFFRRKGVTSYGYALLSERIDFNDFVSMFHGDDERVDQESLRLSTEMWIALARDFLG
jgi:acetylornithine deacetylase/succinyl-diaminopimelate desuccinylase-like protein